MSVDIVEVWRGRAALAEAAVNSRHAHKVWRIPKTNLAAIAWPAGAKPHRGSWHYWWQAHYLDCLVSAIHRDRTAERQQRVSDTIRGIRVRQLIGLQRNKLYDDRSWLALAMNRARKLEDAAKPRALRTLESSITAAQHGPAGAVPWEVGSEFFNVPTNGPAAIMMARNGEIAAARRIVDWIWDTLRNDQGLIMDGWHRDVDRIETAIHPYCQGVVLGAYTEIGLALCKGGTVTPEAAQCFERVQELITAVHEHLANSRGVIDWETGGGDGGLFKGILVEYLAETVVRIPEYEPAQAQARRLAMRMVIASAEAVWRHRLEVDGLPLFAADWTADAQLPVGQFGAKHSRVPEADLSVQLSGWKLLEAAAAVVQSYMAGRRR